MEVKFPVMGLIARQIPAAANKRVYVNSCPAWSIFRGSVVAVRCLFPTCFALTVSAIQNNSTNMDYILDYLFDCYILFNTSKKTHTEEVLK